MRGCRPDGPPGGAPAGGRGGAEAGEARGLLVVDAPVSGGPEHGAAGELTLFAGGMDTVQAGLLPQRV
ncbi:hypothetical protein HFP15_01740 [Amycolatopsis sp. K13G38]|uniref:6-phosphogluconate dehydrogenase NADP-binding domain-containing protein n=1 Tax=Amycolatopsis acididurans TaxID=2724524 RepID=A0ABX1IVV2_9PSEU|nr:NAD(P)-binding domain-containing protein [Amycolatopsis acididurans]NKQ51598.1 hypothetical protein [Amycolatopsis acididurans]